jgi:hypothetical protein
LLAVGVEPFPDESRHRSYRIALRVVGSNRTADSGRDTAAEKLTREAIWRELPPLMRVSALAAWGAGEGVWGEQN